MCVREGVSVCVREGLSVCERGCERVRVCVSVCVRPPKLLKHWFALTTIIHFPPLPSHQVEAHTHTNPQLDLCSLDQ